MLYYVTVRNPFGKNEVRAVFPNKDEAKTYCEKLVGINQNREFHDSEDKYMAFEFSYNVISEKEGLKIWKSERRWIGFLQTNEEVFAQRAELLKH